MGLFTNTKHEEAKKKILGDVAVINNALRKTANTLDTYGGINGTSMKIINQIFEDIQQNVIDVSTTIQSMSDSQLTDFNVPWIDGRYLGIMTWLYTMQMTINKIITEIENEYGL